MYILFIYSFFSLFVHSFIHLLIHSFIYKVCTNCMRNYINLLVDLLVKM